MQHTSITIGSAPAPFQAEALKAYRHVLAAPTLKPALTPLPFNLDLGDLGPETGYAILGDQSEDEGVGFRVGGGLDVNGDDIPDYIVSAPGDNAQHGSAFVVFGRADGAPASVDLTALGGSDGFVILGRNDQGVTGYNVSFTEDVNGDGIADILVAARQSDTATLDNAGLVYVVYGRDTGFPASIDLNSLSGADGFTIEGLQEAGSLGSGFASIGDVNGDGITDLGIGAPFADAPGRESTDNSGFGYVVFGRSDGFATAPDLAALDGSNGFVIATGLEGDQLGRKVTGIGDINDDGFDDFLIGAPGADDSGTNAGNAYVVYGTDQGFAATLDPNTLNGVNGFVISGLGDADLLGSLPPAVGDLNNDGIDDLILASELVDGGGTNRGSVYVVYGSSAGFGASFDLASLDGTNGFVITGEADNDRLGTAIASGADVTGDGIDDLVISAPLRSSNGQFSGSVYVFAGGQSVAGGVKSIAGFSSSDGGLFIGDDEEDRVGGDVAIIGDVNGDGAADILIGARNADPTADQTGAAYVVFGSLGGNNPATDEDTPLTLDLLANFTDPDGDPLTLTGSSGAAGATDVTGGTSLVYDPTIAFESLLAGESATDVFSYTVSDGTGATAVGSLTVTVTGLGVANTGPAAQDDTASTNEETTINIAVLDNDSDADSDGLTLLGAATATSGTASAGGGTVSFNPNADFETLGAGESALATVTYSISDGNGASDAATVTITVTGVNDAPTARADAVTLDEDAGVAVLDLLANDSDIDGTLSIASVNGAAVGAVALGGGSVSYDPGGAFESLAAGETAVESFTYTLSDGAASAVAAVTVTITGVNDAPIARGESGLAGSSDTLTLGVLDNDSDVEGDALTLTGAGGATSGTVAVSGDQLFYTPNADVFGALGAGESATDVFTYTVSDGQATTTAAVTVTLQAPEETVFNAIAAPGSVLEETGGTTGAATAVSFTIARTGNLSGEAQVDFQIAGTGAHPLSVFDLDDPVAGFPSGTIVFADGQESASVTLTLLADALVEQDETVALTLDNPLADSGFAVVGSATATLTILNDDIPGDTSDELDNSLVGTPGPDDIRAGDGNDGIDGGDGDDKIRGDRGDDVLNGGFGDDFLNGGNDNDRIFGGDGEDVVDGGRGDDIGFGGDGDDDLRGRKGDDVLFGGAGRDLIDGGKGNDVLKGGTGDDDRMNGGPGADTFIYALGDGDDVIEDFTPDEDILDLSAHGLADFAAFQAASAQVGATVFFTAADGGVLRLFQTDLSNLDAGDFVF